MRFLAILDPHTTDKPPRFRTAEYNDDVFAKLVAATDPEKVGEYDFIIMPGDVFHNPRPSKVSHALVNRWLAFLDNSGSCPIMMLGGNHDMAAGRVESMPKQPLGTLIRHSRVTFLENGRVDEWRFNGELVTIAGVSWNYAEDAAYIKAWLPGKVDILVLHAPITPQGSPHYFTIHPKELAGLARVIIYGHCHIPDKVYSLGGTLFVNPGALSRGSIAEDDAKRKPTIASVILGENGASAEYIEIPHRPEHEVFRLDLAEAKTSGNEAIAAFVANLGAATVKSVTLEDLVAEAGKLAGDKKIAAAVQDILYSVAQ